MPGRILFCFVTVRYRSYEVLQRISYEVNMTSTAGCCCLAPVYLWVWSLASVWYPSRALGSRLWHQERLRRVSSECVSAYHAKQIPRHDVLRLFVMPGPVIASTVPPHPAKSRRRSLVFILVGLRNSLQSETVALLPRPTESRKKTSIYDSSDHDTRKKPVTTKIYKTTAWTADMLRTLSAHRFSFALPRTSWVRT